MILQGTQAAYHEPVGAVPAKVATSGMIYANDLHALEDLQPMQHPAPLIDAGTQWRL